MNAIIVLPTYNEKDNIKFFIGEIFNIIPQIQILIVDGNSSDGTSEIVDQLALRYSNIRVLHQAEKSGLGRAYLEGFREVMKMDVDYIIQMDSDFSHDPKYIPCFLEAIKKADLVIGSRFLKKWRLPKNVSLLSWASSFYAKSVLKLPIRDSMGGFKCFRKSILDERFLDSFISKGFLFQAEFNCRVFRRGFNVKEVPICFFKRKTGNSKKSLAVILEAIVKIFLLKKLIYNSTLGRIL